ncbi:MAG: MjaI family restriction endonuclease [Candidatus Asgardarchaeum sp.]
MPELKLGIKLTVDEIRSLITREELKLPKYAAPIINLANRFAQATRPNIVGKMSELIRECPYRNLEGWKQWYMARYPKAIENATKKLWKCSRGLEKSLMK